MIDLLGATVTGFVVDGDALGTLILDFADGAQITVPAAATPYDDSWELNHGSYL